MISNIHKNCMGTISFDLKTKAMRKAQDFIVYPIKHGCDRLIIQSGTRIGWISLQGHVHLSKPHASGAYFLHLTESTFHLKLTEEDWFMLKAQVFASAHGAAGKVENGFIQCDNSGALSVFQ
jgi:hypothetical protein